MACTVSGDYVLPGRIAQKVSNLALSLVPWVPRWLGDFVLRHHGYYQTFETSCEDMPASSYSKWQTLQLPADLAGKTLVDIGCAEGFFCLQAARQGADMVLGIDARVKTLVCAKLLAMKQRAPIRYEVAAFPGVRLSDEFDYVLCLSVLHHCVSTKDIWKALSARHHAADRDRLMQCLSDLRSMTRPGGSCIVEIPYEYDDPRERQEVDYGCFERCLVDAGFAAARTIGQWEDGKGERKDRVIYVGLR